MSLPPRDEVKAVCSLPPTNPLPAVVSSLLTPGVLIIAVLSNNWIAGESFLRHGCPSTAARDRVARCGRERSPPGFKPSSAGSVGLKLEFPGVPLRFRSSGVASPLAAPIRPLERAARSAIPFQWAPRQLASRENGAPAGWARGF